MSYANGPWAGDTANSPKIPEAVRAMDFDALVAAVEATGGEYGAALVKKQRERIATGGCTQCERLAAAARLRVYLAKKEMEP